MQGVIVQINLSSGGLPKHPVSGGLLTAEGLEGDVHAHPQVHGGPRKAVLLIAAETIDKLAACGYPLFYGALGENLTTRIGDRLRAGEALIEITAPRGPCGQLDIYGESLRKEIYDARVEALEQGSPRWGMSGLYASVIRSIFSSKDEPEAGSEAIRR